MLVSGKYIFVVVKIPEAKIFLKLRSFIKNLVYYLHIYPVIILHSAHNCK